MAGVGQQRLRRPIHQGRDRLQQGALGQAGSRPMALGLAGLTAEGAGMEDVGEGLLLQHRLVIAGGDLGFANGQPSLHLGPGSAIAKTPRIQTGFGAGGAVPLLGGGLKILLQGLTPQLPLLSKQAPAALPEGGPLVGEGHLQVQAGGQGIQRQGRIAIQAPQQGGEGFWADPAGPQTGKAWGA